MDTKYLNLPAGNYMKLNNPRFQVQANVRPGTPENCAEYDLLDVSALSRPMTASELNKVLAPEGWGFTFRNRYDLPEKLMLNDMPLVYGMLLPGLYVVDPMPRAIYFVVRTYPRTLNTVRLLSWRKFAGVRHAPLYTQPLRITSVTNKKMRQDFDKWMTEVVRKHKLLQTLRPECHRTLERNDYSALVSKLYLTSTAPHVAATELLEATNKLWIRDYVEVGQKVWFTDSITWED